MMWAKSFDPAAAGADLPGSPDLVFVFGPAATLRETATLARLAALYPEAIPLGCSTGSAVMETVIDDAGASALAMGFASTRATLHTHPLTDPLQSREAGRALAAGLAGPDLAGLFLLSVGLDVNGSSLVEGMRDVLGNALPISGGLAGDGARFEDTLLAIGGEAMDGMIAAVALRGEAIRITHGCFGGWDEFGPRRTITAAEGAVLRELDGKPALDLYETYLGEEAANLPASGLFYPLRVWDPADPEHSFVRTVLAVDRAARTLTFAGDVPQGWRAQLMRGTIDNLVDGAQAAARQASEAMAAQGVVPEVCLFVSCVGRRLLMGQRTEEEIEAVAAAIGPQVPLGGFYSYGEIAPQNSRSPTGFHNQTVTLTLWAEAA